MRSFHANALRQLPHLAVAQYKLLLQIRAFKVLSRLAQWHGQQILFYEWLVHRGRCTDFRLDILQRYVLSTA
jgi:hypothetical protein